MRCRVSLHYPNVSLRFIQRFLCMSITQAKHNDHDEENVLVINSKSR